MESSNLIQLEVNVVLSSFQFTRVLVVLVARIDRLLLRLKSYSILAAACLLLSEQRKHGIIQLINLVHDLFLVFSRVQASSLILLIENHLIDRICDLLTLER